MGDKRQSRGDKGNTQLSQHLRETQAHSGSPDDPNLIIQVLFLLHPQPIEPGIKTIINTVGLRAGLSDRVLAKSVQLLGHGWDRQRWGGAERMAQRASHQDLAPQTNPH